MTYSWHPLYGREFVVKPYGNGEMLHCMRVGDRSAARVLLPRWIFDPVACSVMREVSAPVSCLSALDELRRVLLEMRALDSLPAPGETRAYEQAPSSSTSPAASVAL